MTSRSIPRALSVATGLAFLLGALAAPAAQKAPAVALDVNSATAAQLESLPGVGAATAKKIIAGRPYTTLDELATKAGIPAKTVEKLKPMLSVGAAPAAPAAPAPAPAAKVPAAKAPAAPPMPAARAPAPPAAPAGPVDLNTATAAQLEGLPGIGAATAKKIIAGRPYKSVDELSTKAGIPAMNLSKFRSLVSVGGAAAAPPAAPSVAVPAVPAVPAAKAAAPAPPAQAPAAPKAHPAAAPKLAPGTIVNINTAPKELLDALPGIGPVKAQAIIEGRPYTKIEDVMKVKGIKQGEFAKIKDLITVK